MQANLRLEKLNGSTNDDRSASLDSSHFIFNFAFTIARRVSWIKRERSECERRVIKVNKGEHIALI